MSKTTTSKIYYKAEFIFNSAHDRYPLTPEADIKTMLNDISESLDYVQTIHVIEDVTIEKMVLVSKKKHDSDAVK